MLPTTLRPDHPSIHLQEIMSLFEQREAAVADSPNQRRQLMEVQGMGEMRRMGRAHQLSCACIVYALPHASTNCFCAASCRLATPALLSPLHPAVLLHIDMAAKHDMELGQVRKAVQGRDQVVIRCAVCAAHGCKQAAWLRCLGCIPMPMTGLAAPAAGRGASPPLRLLPGCLLHSGGHPAL